MVNGKPLQRKLVVLGDGACGKTSLLTVFTKGFFPSDYEPTVFENYVEMLEIDGQMLEFSLWDTAGQEDFDRLRSLSYADTNVVMICFSVDRPVSLENVEHKWILEVNEHCAGVKVVLIALKCDLRDDPQLRHTLAQRGEAPLTYDQGLDMAKRIGATRYLECSAKHNRGVQEALQEAARIAIGGKSRGGGGGGVVEKLRRGDRPRRCIIM